MSTFTPFDLNTTSTPIIAPFFADVDTRNAGDPVTYGPWNRKWPHGIWCELGKRRLLRQLLPGEPIPTVFSCYWLIERDTGAGNFDIYFNYDRILWETGTASGGNANGLGGIVGSSWLFQRNSAP